MGSKYTTQATTGYNASPPPDDGSQSASNLISWTGIKSKIGDVLKTFGEAINSALVSAFDYSVRRITTSDSTVASDHMRTVEIAPTVTTAITVSLGDAATMTNVYKVWIKNSSAVNQTIGRLTGADTIDGIARDLKIPAGACWLLQTNNAADGYILTGEYRESEPQLCDGRLTLTSGTAVTTADVTSATTVYFTPFRSNRVSLYDGTRWRRYILAEVSVAVPSTSSTVYDVFLYDNAGTLTLDATAWTNDTTRATALTTQDGVLVKTGATGRRYVGTFRTTGLSGQTEDTAAKRYIWNYYNRARKMMRNASETADSWSYATSTIRQANGNAANQLDMVIGVSEDVVDAKVVSFFQNSSAGGGGAVGIGLDATNANVSGFQATRMDVAATNADGNASAQWAGFPGIGRHFMPWLEWGNGTGTQTWFGDRGSAATYQSGITGSILC